MNRDKLIILAIFFLAAVAIVGYPLLRGDNSALQPDSTARLNRTHLPVVRGITLQLHNGDPTCPYEKYIDEIAATGADTVCLVLAGYQENCSSTSIFIDARKTPTDARLKKLIAHARRRGLRVALMPVVLLENPRQGEWRGKIAPENWFDWWQDYSSFILHYADIAEATGTEIFIIGSELVSTESYTDRWSKLILRVRKAYRGLLSYSANWDHYEGIKWWGDLDIIGMNSYYDLTGGKTPTLEVLLAGWKPIKTKLLAWQSKIGRPILFTEVGWPNQVTCAQYPWDYYRSEKKPDPAAQANCFEAFFRTWTNEKAVAGFLVWEWRNNPSQAIGPKDTSYVPCGKPALEVIKKYYRYPSRPVDRRDRLTASRPATKPAASP